MNVFILPPLINRSAYIAGIAKSLNKLDESKGWRIEITEAKPLRSNQQNRYLFGVVYHAILKQGKLEGWSVEDVHEYCLGQWSGWETVDGLGRKRVRPIRRSSKLSKAEFAEYVLSIQRDMAELGINVPDPL